MNGEVTTYRLRTGVEVFARMEEGTPRAVGYANRTQASMKAAELGDEWYVYHPGRPFYVAKVNIDKHAGKPKIAIVPTTKEDYWRALGSVPPKTRTSLGFLVGEAYSFRVCRMTGKPSTTYSAYFVIEGRHYDAEPLTVEEFNTVTVEDLKALEVMEK